MPDVRDLLLLQIRMHALADIDQPILVAAGEIEQLELLFGFGRVRDQLIWLAGVRRRRKRAHPCKSLEVFEQLGWMKLNGDATNLGSSEVYDNLLIDRRNTREWTGAAGTWRFDEMDYGNDDRVASELVSDHRPVWGEFLVVGVDDD